jgi:hypothetical protein
VPRAGQAPTRVVCQARGLVSRREHEGLDTQRLLVV